MIFNRNGEWPRIGMVCLEEDTIPSGANGQVEAPSVEEVSAIMAEPPSGEPEGTEPPEETYFHSITVPGEDGAEDEVLNFKDPKELSDRYMKNRFRRSDYTKKTQELAEQRKAFEAQQAALLEKETMLTRTSNQYQEYDNLLKSLTPEQFQKVVEEVKGVATPENPETKALKERLDALDAEKQKAEREQALQRKKEAQLGKFESKGRYLKSQLSDYDHETVMKAWNELNDIAPEEAEQAVLEMLYYANKGRGASVPKGDPAGPPRARVAGKAPVAGEKPMSIREAKARALAEID